MTTQIADALVIVLPRGETLKGWLRRGLLEREWSVHEELAPHFGRIVVVSEGDDGERHVGSTLTPMPVVVSNEEGAPRDSFSAEIPSRVLAALQGVKSALVKTIQLPGAVVAVRIARALREQGIRTGLVVRGEYLCSRFLAYEHGQSADAVLEAAAEEGEACRAADVVVGTSRAMVGDLSWRSGLTMDRMALIPNHVLATEMPALPEEREKHEVLFAGPLVKRKRVDILVDALAQLPDDVRAKTHLTILGDGPERASLEARAKEQGVDVRFEGWVKHRRVLDRMRHCTVYAHPSELEGHPKSVLEAMAAGAPVLVSDAPGVGSTIEHGLTGLKLPLIPEPFGRAIEMLLMDADLRMSLGMEASRIVREVMSVVRVAELERQVLQRAMDRAGEGVMLPTAAVRFDPELLRGNAQDQAAAWRRAIETFAHGLPPAGRAAFVIAMQRQVGLLGSEGPVSRVVWPEVA